MNQTPAGKAFVAFNNALDSNIAKKIGLRNLLEKAIEKVSYRVASIATKKSRKFDPKSSKSEADRLKDVASKKLFDLNYNEEQSLVQETIQDFTNRFVKEKAEHISEAEKIPAELSKEFDQLGLPFYSIPEAQGGVLVEKATVTQMIIAEELAKGDFGIAYSLLAPIGALNAIVAWGNAEQQAKYIPHFIDEEKKLIASIAIDEPTALFNPFTLETKAKEQGGKYILSGKKSLVPLAKHAELFLIAAEVEGKGPQIFLVESNTEGLSLRETTSMGLKPAELGEITLNNVSVDKGALLGNGHDYEAMISHIRLGWCSLAIGTCQSVLDYTIEYCNNRVAFGEPITHRQAVAFMIANIKIELDGMKLMTQRAASKIEQGLDYNKECYLASLACGERAMEIGNDGVQLLGGHGFIRDFPVERWYRDLRSVAISYNGMHL
jgi:alkylation response protein AidB-like acyl-CoA dehydrogenase